MVLDPQELDGQGIARSLNDFRGYFDALNEQPIPELSDDDTDEEEAELDVEPAELDDEEMDAAEPILLEDEPEDENAEQNTEEVPEGEDLVLPESIAPTADAAQTHGDTDTMTPKQVSEYVRNANEPLIRAIEQIVAVVKQSKSVIKQSKGPDRRAGSSDKRLASVVEAINAARGKDRADIARLSASLRQVNDTLGKTIEGLKSVAARKGGKADGATREAVKELIVYLHGQHAVSPPPMVDGDFGILSTLHQIDGELSRTRPGNVSGDGVSIINDGRSIGIVADDVEEADGFILEEGSTLYKVTGSTPVAGSPTTKWTYTGERITGKTTAAYGDYWTTDGVEVTMYNVAEVINTTTGRQGNGINVDTALFTDNDFDFYPIQTGTPVVVRQVAVGSGSTAVTEYWIVGAGMPNGVDGECA